MRGTSVGIYSTTNIPSYPLFEDVFDGSYYLENTSPTGLPTGNSSKTIMAWVKVPQPTTAQYIFGFGSLADEHHEFSLIYNHRHRELEGYWDQYFSPIQYYGDSSFILAPNTWYFIGMTYNNNTNELYLHVYVNGRSRHSAVWASGVDANSDSIRVGLGLYQLNAYSNLFKGSIENISLWDRVLPNYILDDYYELGKVGYSDITEEIKETSVLVVTNSQSQSLILSNLQERHFGLTGITCSDSSPLETSGEGVIDAETSSINNITCSEGGILEACSPTVADIFISTGAHLEFGKTILSPVPPISFWNLSEESGTRYDSVGSNHLSPMITQASFDYQSSALVNTNLTFTDTSVLAFSWYWDFGDGNNSTDQNPTHTYESAGSFTVSLFINGNESLNASNVVVINNFFLCNKMDLSSQFNVIGVAGSDYSRGMMGYGLDLDTPGTGGNAVNGPSVVSNYPPPITVNNIEFDFPVVGDGSTNNTIYCVGQTITLSGAQFDYIYMLGFAVNNTQVGDFVVNYSDSTTFTQNQSFSDWFGDATFENEIQALNTGLLRSDSLGPIYIKMYQIAIDRTKNAVSLTLPNTKDIILFSITQASAVSPMKMWNKANAIFGNGSPNDGDTITAWHDSSNNGHNLIQATEELKPVYKTNIINGYPVVRFTGSGLSGGAYAAGNSFNGMLTANGNYSVITVIKQSTTGNFAVAASWGQNGDEYVYWNGYIPDSSGQPYPGSLIVASDSRNDIYYDSVDDTNWHVCTGVFNGAYLSGWEKQNPAIGAGVDAVGNHNGASGTLTHNLVKVGCYINDAYFWNGDIAEIMFFDVALSDSDREVIESYLIYKYNLQPQNEIQQLSFDNSPTTGTYTLTVNGQTTANINYNDDATAVQAAITNVLGAGTISVS